ncbi:multidrug effflux MFS transporter [Pseudodonghicola xiamenensis]|uniref:Bcr/CflA family efflux transporter n=1 Tax=Pseudodonghicola xiamenensis TaxID=337702 RepID=A0A8J3MD11_9RHOB|nr:multidrug effflux MFS transporter [Pseudodonghicola xiamenensis]GHG80288.1 Bcr/CflA family drug resistance efflux transporter [Pseudodonghicola xiamenensis]
MRPATTPPHLLTLILANALSVLTLNMFLPSLAKMAEALNADYGLVNLSVAGYLAISAVLQLAMGPLSDRYGRRPVMVLTTAIFVLASVGCALAQNVWVFLGFRMLQAGIVSGQVLSRAVIRDMHAPKDAAKMLGHVAMAMALAPMLGPMLGGALDMAFGWRSSFVLYSLLGAVMLVILWADLGETNAAAASFSFRDQIHDYPELFRSRRFWGYSLCYAFAVAGFFAFITGAPLVAAAWYDLSPAALGLGIGIITVGFMVGNFVSGLVGARAELVTMVLVGRIFATLGPIGGLALFFSGAGTLWVFFGSAIVVGFGNGLTNANANAGVMSVRPRLAGSASGLSGAMTVALGAIMTSLTGALVTPDHAPYIVLSIMLVTSALGLIAALYVRWVDRRDPLPLGV